MTTCERRSTALSNASPRAGMPSWNPFSRGRSPRAARERLASARALAESTRDLRAAAAADEGAAKPTPEQALVALQAPPGAGIQSTARLRRVAGDADDAARAGRARRALDRRGHVPRRGLPGGLRGRGQARGRRRRAPPGPGPGARGRARRRGPRRPRRLRGGPAGRRRRARRGARRRAQGRGHDRHLRRDHAVLGRDDNLNGAGRRRRGDGPPAHARRPRGDPPRSEAVRDPPRFAGTTATSPSSRTTTRSRR